jgi:hypothetical protein
LGRGIFVLNAERIDTDELIDPIHLRGHILAEVPVPDKEELRPVEHVYEAIQVPFVVAIVDNLLPERVPLVANECAKASV